MGVVNWQGHTIGPVSYKLTSFSFHINQTNKSCNRAISKFDLETSKVKVMSEVKGQGHIFCTQYPTNALHFLLVSHKSDQPFLIYGQNSVWPWNKANLRDLIAATGLIILLKFDPNHQFSSPCGLEIWCMTSKNNRAPLLYYIKLCVSFQIHRWIQTEVTLWKRSIRVEIGDFLSLVTLKFDGCWKTIGHLFYTTSSFVHHFKSIGELKLKLQSRNTQFG